MDKKEFAIFEKIVLIVILTIISVFGFWFKQYLDEHPSPSEHANPISFSPNGVFHPSLSSYLSIEQHIPILRIKLELVNGELMSSLIKQNNSDYYCFPDKKSFHFFFKNEKQHIFYDGTITCQNAFNTNKFKIKSQLVNNQKLTGIQMMGESENGVYAFALDGNAVQLY